MNKEAKTIDTMSLHSKEDAFNMSKQCRKGQHHRQNQEKEANAITKTLNTKLKQCLFHAFVYRFFGFHGFVYGVGLVFMGLSMGLLASFFAVLSMVLACSSFVCDVVLVLSLFRLWCWNVLLVCL